MMRTYPERLFQFLPLFLLGLALVLSGCDSSGSNDDDPPPSDDVVVTIDSLVSESDNFTTLNQALVAANVTALDDENTNYTVFAPTDDAFNALNVDALLGSDALGSVLQYHVIEGDSLGSGDLSDGQTLTTLAGQDLTVEVDESGNVSVEGSPVTDADITADNGVIHGIGDKPLLGNQELTNVLQFVSETQELVSVVVARGLADGIGGSDVGTVFAPNNSAVSGNSETIDNLSDEEVQSVLEYHTLADETDSGALLSLLSDNDGQVTVTTRQGEDLVIAQDGDGNVLLNPTDEGAQATLDTDNVDFEGTNNITHVIDGLLIPPSFADGGGASFEVVANESDLTPSGGSPDAHCIVEDSDGTLTFFNSEAGGIYSWDGSSLTTRTSPTNLNENISGESNTIDRCDGVAKDGNDNVYFLLRSNASSETNSWPTYVYKLESSGASSVLASGDGLQSVVHNNGTVYLTGVEFRGASEDGFYSVDDTGSGQSVSTVATEAALDLNYGMDVDSNGDLYAFSGGFADGNRVRKIVRVTDPSGSPTIEEFVDPYRDGSPLVPDSGSDIEDVDFVSQGGTEYLVVYNGSFEAGNGEQWASIQVSDQSISLLFNRSQLISNSSAGDFVSGFTEPVAVNADGDIVVTSRSASFGGEYYIARVSNVLP